MGDAERFYVGKRRSIPRRRGVVVALEDGREIAVFDVEGSLYAISNICPHQHSAVLAEGHVEDGCVTCPLHGWVYDIRTGRAVVGGRALETYTVVEEEGEVFVDVPPAPPPKWMEWGEG